MELESVNQENAARAEEMASSTKSLAGQVQNLESLLSEFKLNKQASISPENYLPDFDYSPGALTPLTSDSELQKEDAFDLDEW